jgi:RNA polymerase sigma-70 factor (ECF subfamily)
MVLAAGGQTSPQSAEALETLCETYWYPLYAYLRHSGCSADEARDLTQEFFAHLLEKKSLAVADRERGRFRSFLLSSLKHFRANERDRARAQKRGGGRTTLSIDLQDAESRYQNEPAHDLTPEKVFERRWALALLDRVLARLREEFAQAGKTKLFDRLKVFLSGEKSAKSQRESADQLGMTEGAVKVAVHRLRRRYRELLRSEIAETVATPDEVEDELRQLLAALGG